MSRRGSHLLLPTLSLPALPMHFSPRLAAAFSTLTCLSSWKIKLSNVQRLHLLQLSGDSGGIQNPEPHPLCLPASAATSLLLFLLCQAQPGQGSLDSAAATANNQPLLTQLSQAPWSKDVCKSSKEDPILLQRGTRQRGPQGMHKQERQNCCSLQELSSIFPRKNPTRVCHPPALVLSKTLQAGQG